ncbi:unnamed protein product, partial [Symbiodinium necroappetens]
RSAGISMEMNPRAYRLRKAPPTFVVFFMRDEERQGRQIDLLLSRHLHVQTATVDPDRFWNNDSRARWVRGEIPDGVIVAFRDDQETKDAIGDGGGEMLANRSSSQLTHEVREHLESKMTDETIVDWDERLQNMVDAVDIRGEFVEFSLLDVRAELVGMRPRSAVGPDGISVDLLRTLASHDSLGLELLSLINHIVSTQQLPESWSQSYLALLAKCDCPRAANDLRPICVSSAFNKLVNRLVCGRIMPHLRRGSYVSCCGKGRQAADLIGAISRIRDVTREWKMPLVIAKLDVAGAFDKVDRGKVAELLVLRAGGKMVDHELRYLLCQLRVHVLEGRVPGGKCIKIRPNNGIKQGAPESAEIFGLMVDAILSDLVASRQWGELGEPCPGLAAELLFYQDDIFVLDKQLGSLARRIRAVGRGLERAGLLLAAKKTKIIASPAFSGARRVRLGSDEFCIAPSSESIKVLGVNFSLYEKPNQQALELLARTRAAAGMHKDILGAKGSWTNKMKMLRCLVESRFTWCAGALHWGNEELQAANTLQLHILRSAFQLRRLSGESWLDWNTRSMRFVRVWLHNGGWLRWSDRILKLSSNSTFMGIGVAVRKYSQALDLPHLVCRCGLLCGGALHGGVNNKLSKSLDFAILVTSLQVTLNASSVKLWAITGQS